MLSVQAMANVMAAQTSRARRIGTSPQGTATRDTKASPQTHFGSLAISERPVALRTGLAAGVPTCKCFSFLEVVSRVTPAPSLPLLHQLTGIRSQRVLYRCCYQDVFRYGSP